MTKASIKIEFVEGQLVTPRRGIAFLVHEDEKHVDGKSIFDKLVGNDEKFIMASMKAWIDGAADIAGRFHGFPGDTTFRDGYVFKWREKRVQNRLYGFKMRPHVLNDRFEICVLAMHSTKNTKETDPWIKTAIGRLRDDEAIRAAIVEQVRKYFALKQQEGWT